MADKGKDDLADRIAANPDLIDQFLALEDSEGGVVRALELLLKKKLLDLQPAFDEYVKTRDALIRLVGRGEPEPSPPSRTRGTSDQRVTRDGVVVTQRKPLGKRKDSILGLVEDFPGIEVWRIAEIEGISPSRASQIISALVEEGRLERTDAGLRVIPDHKNKPTKGIRQT